ncbi:MAG: alpha/beta fold hydrolase [Geodermatophilaceae bacterium]
MDQHVDISRQCQSVTAVGRLHLTSHLPTLLITCEDDPAIPRSHTEAAHAELPGSRLEILPGRSHRPHQRDPERFAEVLADFVRTTEPATGPPAWRAATSGGHAGHGSPRRLDT